MRAAPTYVSGSGVSRDFFSSVFGTATISRLTPLPLFLSILLLTPNLSLADYQAGLNAYAVSDYHQAMQEWRAVTEQPPAEVNPAIYAETHYAIARLYWQGQGVPRDYYQAHDWLIKAAALNHAGAMAKLGFLYTDGITVQQDFNKAFEWYSKAAKLGDVDGLYNLGIFYLNGWGTDPDKTMAKQYLAAASAQGDPEAEEALQQLMAASEPVGAAKAAIESSSEQGPSAEQPTSVGATSVAIIPDENQSRRATAFRQDFFADGKTVHPPSPAPSPLQLEPWILAQNPTHYTIQAIGLTDRQKLEGLIKGHENLAPYAIYTVQKTTRPIHILIQGVYPTVEEARATRDRFPRAINRPSEVWIRQFEKIQAIMEAEK